MPRPLTPILGRRALVTGIATVAAAALVRPAGLLAATGEPLATTPKQTLGPFYPTDWTGDADADLVQVAGEAARAMGQVTHVTGRVLDASGQPIQGASVEIWQCDANGRYRHPRDTSWFGEKRDAAFQGRGRATTDDRGGYAFRTIKPVAYPGRTPHIHFAVSTPGRERLVTQMYVAGEPLNETDGILNGIRDARQRAAVIVALEAADRLETGALAGTFEIVLA